MTKNTHVHLTQTPADGQGAEAKGESVSRVYSRAPATSASAFPAVGRHYTTTHTLTRTHTNITWTRRW